MSNLTANTLFYFYYVPIFTQKCIKKKKKLFKLYLGVGTFTDCFEPDIF